MKTKAIKVYKVTFENVDDQLNNKYVTERHYNDRYPIICKSKQIAIEYMLSIIEQMSLDGIVCQKNGSAYGLPYNRVMNEVSKLRQDYGKAFPNGTMMFDVTTELINAEEKRGARTYERAFECIITPICITMVEM